MANGNFGSIDDDGTFFGSELGSFGGDDRDMAQFETYQDFDIDVKQHAIKKKANDLVDAICQTYFEALYDINEDSEENNKTVERLKTYLEKIKMSEVSVVRQMVKQIKVSEHLLDTLLRRLDGGGFKEDNLYNMIRDQQNSLNKFSIEFSKYVRGLPDYFDNIRTDLGIDKQKTLENISRIQSSNNPMSLGSEKIYEIGEGDEQQQIAEIYTTMPERGTKNMAMRVQDTLERMRNRYRETEDEVIDFDPSDIEPKEVEEENIYTEERYVEEDTEEGFEE